jgi:hypothetical protein
MAFQLCAPHRCKPSAQVQLREKAISHPNSYSEEIRKILPRLLSLFDTDQTSVSYGLGDRYRWAWGLIDFGNGTFQGAAHGLSRLWESDSWPYPTSTEQFLQRIDSLFEGAKYLTGKDGSMEEAFPKEGSYCVTALVAFDLICSIDLMSGIAEERQIGKWSAVVSPMIRYLVEADETHAIISNHLATAAAALARWDKRVKDVKVETKARLLLERILENQSREGWFREYGGADPGYQTLCTYYLADLHQVRPDWNLLPSLRKSVQFIWHFAHPDGSFGGHYGSRCTRFYYPAGMVALAEEIPEAKALSGFMRGAIASNQVVNLSAMDEPNLVPMFNAYAWAATLEANAKAPAEDELTLPAFSKEPFRKHFPEAGMLVDRGEDHYTIINLKKGGVLHHFLKGKLQKINTGIVVRSASGKWGSSQSIVTNENIRIETDKVEIKAQIVEMPKKLPTAMQFLILRILSLCLFRFRSIREWTKRVIVRRLITCPTYWPIWNLRKINLGCDLTISDEIDLPKGYEEGDQLGSFVPFHMASKGYWQVQDEDQSSTSEAS